MGAFSKRRTNRPTLMGNHQRCWIWGRQAVLETLSAGRWPILELHLSRDLPSDERGDAEQSAHRAKATVTVEPAERLEHLCHSGAHQGYVAKMPPFPYDDADALLASRSEIPFYVVLDSIQDPFNFGAILRTAEAMVVDGLFVGAANQVEVNSLVVRASAGAVNHLRLARVDDVADWVRRLRSAGITTVATSPVEATDVSECDFRGPVAVVIGNEGAGIGSEVLAQCDARVSIRQRGHVGSLNAAVSAGILFYEVCRQRNERGAAQATAAQATAELPRPDDAGARR